MERVFRRMLGNQKFWPIFFVLVFGICSLANPVPVGVQNLWVHVVALALIQAAFAVGSIWVLTRSLGLQKPQEKNGG